VVVIIAFFFRKLLFYWCHSQCLKKIAGFG
jgi:hypothetical protein